MIWNLAKHVLKVTRNFSSKEFVLQPAALNKIKDSDSIEMTSCNNNNQFQWGKTGKGKLSMGYW